jgi:hypothetical protein
VYQASSKYQMRLDLRLYSRSFINLSRLLRHVATRFGHSEQKVLAVDAWIRTRCRSGTISILESSVSQVEWLLNGVEGMVGQQNRDRGTSR